VDRFFARHVGFDYDRTRPVMEEFNRMVRDQGWNKNQRRRQFDHLRNRMVDQFNEYYGNDIDDINAWRAMCTVLGISPVPDDLQSCRSIVKKQCANIWDYVEAKRLGIEVKRFPTLKNLARYTYKHNKVFPKEHAKAGGVLKYLLRTISVYAGRQ
ncbi:hypothetical protein BXZ70DRAFT_899690, partial [Cristinia sonorae]